jgi:hypothetical protein
MTQSSLLRRIEILEQRSAPDTLPKELLEAQKYKDLPLEFVLNMFPGASLAHHWKRKKALMPGRKLISAT